MAAVRPWFLTCFAQGSDYLDEQRNMVASFRRYHPTVPVITGENPIQDPGTWGQITNFKARWCYETFKTWGHLGDMVWIDADARIRKAIVPPEGDFTVAAKMYGDDWSTGTLWFRRNPFEFLDRWLLWCMSTAKDEEGFLQAVTSTGCVPVDLPDSLTSVCSPVRRGQPEPFSGTLWHDSSIVHWNRSRKVLGMIDDWPPPERIRYTCKSPGS